MHSDTHTQSLPKTKHQVVRIALIVALGGLLMGFDASVISGVIGFIEKEFSLSKMQLGWSVSSLTVTATLAMMIAGPLSNKYGRRRVLSYAALLYTISAVGSALAPDFTSLVIFRMLGGFGVGASLIIAPMYIAEISPPALRGRMVSFNQLNIVIGISLAFFSNYLILQLADSGTPWTQSWGIAEHPWRWMLGLEAFPAIFYYLALFFVPRSPRWLMIKGRFEEARKVMLRFDKSEVVDRQIEDIKKSLNNDQQPLGGLMDGLKELLKPSLRKVMIIGLVLAVLQQITGINSVFFYAPMIFEQSGIGTDASFVQAILVGIINLVFTLLAILLIDRFGRRPLLLVGIAGITLSMMLLFYGFQAATYTITPAMLEEKSLMQENLNSSLFQTYYDERAFRSALDQNLGADQALAHADQLTAAAIEVNTGLILFGILGFVASFAISIGPVMWVLFSELFPNRVRGLAISVVGLANSAVSFLVQLVFPWELSNLGSAVTFLIYGIFALVGFVFTLWLVPETKGKSLEQLEIDLTQKTAST